MYNILIYKNKASLKSQFENHSLSTFERHTLHFCTNSDHVFTQIGQGKADSLFIFTDDISDDDKNLIKLVLKSSNRIHIALFSKEIYAMDAWRLHMFHFDHFPVEIESVRKAFARLMHYINPTKGNVLTIKLADGTHNIPFTQLKYLHASGNYTFIHYGENEHFFITKQLGNFDFIIEKDATFQRVHRSLIINTSNIKSIEGQSIFFTQGKKPLEVSQSLSTKIRKTIS